MNQELSMNRMSLIAIVIATLGATAAEAGDITIDTTPFVSTRTRAEVQAQLAQPGPNVWSTSYNQLAQFQPQRSRAEVRAEYLAARSQVEAVTAEDSGSAYLIRARAERAAATRVASRAQ
jgi:predicted secreted Zn-dependent protease